MMAQKNLHDLLKEDQEPFLLKNYITDRRCQLGRPSPKTQLQVKKRKPISETPSFPGNFRKNVCFLSFHDSPDLRNDRKSPMFDFSSPAKSPCRSPNAILLHIPARTAALLLEAALRIQKQSSATKPKTQNKNPAFGLFGSILKRLTHRSRKREIEGDEGNVSVKDILMWDSSVGRRRTCNESLKKMQKKIVAEGDESASKINACETNHSCSCNSRPSSAFWSESNEDRSLDMDFSSSSQSVDSEVLELLSRRREDTDFYCCEKRFCESSFRFVLHRSPSSGRRTPEFTSPTASPIHHKTEEKETSCGSNFEEEEDKEQCSPVSVLDPPFEDDDRHEDEEDVDENGDDSFDDECSSSSYAIVQRAKQKLLLKLRRFEKLAGLDPIELEKIMLEEEDEDDDDSDHNADDLEEEDKCEYVLEISDREKNVESFVMEVIGKSRFQNSLQISQDMKRLVSDLIAEEGREQSVFDNDGEELVNRVCKRLEAWKEVESNTINMMVEQDLRRGLDGWKRNQEQVGETALEIEMAIFELLVQEVFEELVSLGGK
ncbi:hypothetical protein F2P56_010204 [Juglans regia]|uniref:Uncharacterized protein LOC109005146 n=2 Tax=Juglans regia TaxID=51240 RepID=A0A2I4G6H2_JUGRE|nr:uncharacterized protein LOC109005146 [Juglans regia]KAF5473604.1 hypothetical protein F2P56_010204 [Juglans regia]